MSPHDELSIDVSQIAPVHLELATSRAHDLVGPYGAFVATMAPEHLAQQAWGAHPFAPNAQSEWRAPAPTSAATARVLDTLAVLPVGVWKRVALYAFLFFVFGNLLRCGGLATFTNVACAILIVLGLAGLVACAQRNP